MRRIAPQGYKNIRAVDVKPLDDVSGIQRRHNLILDLNLKESCETATKAPESTILPQHGAWFHREQ